MRQAATNHPPRSRSLKEYLAFALSVAAIGAGFYILGLGFQTGDPSVLPVMAEQPVVLNDGRKIYVQKHEVSVAEWNRCHDAGACLLELRVRPGWDPAQTPATGLNFVDVLEYLHWINIVSGRDFRLPTQPEWTQMAAEVMPEQPDPLFTDPSLTWASTYMVENLPARALKPRGSFPATSQGIEDLSGSVWEWTSDCYDKDDPDMTQDRCPAFYMGGEHLSVMSYLIRDPARGGCAVGSPPAHLGMRLISDNPITDAGA